MPKEIAAIAAVSAVFKLIWIKRPSVPRATYLISSFAPFSVFYHDINFVFQTGNTD